MSPNAGMGGGGVAGPQLLSTAVSMEPQINFGDQPMVVIVTSNDVRGTGAVLLGSSFLVKFYNRYDSEYVIRCFFINATLVCFTFYKISFTFLCVFF
jgi:hypothetical protein